MIRLPFGKKILKARWLTEDISKKWPPKKLVGAISYETLVGSHSNSLGISDDLIDFWEKSIENKMADGGHFEKIATEELVGAISYEPFVGSHSNCMQWFSHLALSSQTVRLPV